MLRLISKISIGNYTFNYTTRISIEKSFETMTDTATITMPNKFLKDNKTLTVGTDNIFNKNDKVVIQCGYFPNLKTEFVGYIAKIVPDSPLTLMCEDRMFLLKQKNIKSKSFSNTTIGKVVKYVAPGEDIDFDDEHAVIGSFDIDNTGFINAVEIFDALTEFGFKIFYKDERLQVRIMPSILSRTADTHSLVFQNNVINSQLEYVKEDDTTIAIKGESIQENNDRIILYGLKENGKVIVTDQEQSAAQTKALVKYDLSRNQLKAEIERRIDDFIYNGYNGSITTFFEPSITPQDKIKLIDYKNTERTDTYLTRGTIKEFGVNGGRQSVEPRNKVTA